mmetsp:Transcript_57188/g.134598  ORF Transcript_57188/g.134598 Transcript_57188/m.134598 type:complete len:160 (-) Transcript_57188:40-519(-)
MGLLKGIDPLLSADLLFILRSMGHGDSLCICDCNFPAFEVSGKTTSQRLVHVGGADLPQVVNAVCSVMPLDFFIEDPALHMAPQAGVSMPPLGTAVIADAQAAVSQHCPGMQIKGVERFEFYERARKCFAVVQTLERRPYGNVILTKGVVGPDGKDLKP